MYFEECDAALLDQDRFEKALIKIIDSMKEANIHLVYPTSRNDDQAASDGLRKKFGRSFRR